MLAQRSRRRSNAPGALFAVVALAAVSLIAPTARAATGSHSWSMNEAAGSGTMVDSGSPATNGAWLNIQAGVPGFAGTGYRFNGTSRVTVADAASLDPGSDTFTVTAHAKFTGMPTAAVGGDYDLVRKGLSSTSGGYWKLEIYPNSSHTKAQGLCQMKGSTNSVKIVGSPSSLNNGQWHTLSCTKTSSTVTLTVDGTSYSKSVTIGSIANSDSLTLGAKKNGGDWYTGDMDEVAYQISGGSPPPPPPPPPGGISQVQSKKASATATGITATLGSRPASGDVLVAVVVVADSASPSFATPSGWTKPFTPARGAVFWKVSNGSEQTVTVNLASGQTARVLRMWVVELRGISTSSAFDQGGSGTFGSSTSATPMTPGPTAQTAEWAIAAVAQNGDSNGGSAATNGFSILSPDGRSIGATKVLSATGTVSTTISWTTARAGSWIIATFRGA